MRAGVTVLIGVLLAAPSARAAAPVRVYDAASGALTVPFRSDRRDEVLLALENDGTMLINRWRHGRGSGRALQRIGLDGRARADAVDWRGIESRMWTSAESVSPDGRLVAYRNGPDFHGGPVRVELARTANAAHRAVSPYFETEPGLGWSPDGRTLVITGRRNGRYEAWTLGVADRRARRRAALVRRPGSSLAVAPGGTRFAYGTYAHRGRPYANVVVVDLAARTRRLLQPASIEDPGLNGPLGLESPLWSPAGDLIAVERAGTFDLELLDPAGARRTVVPIQDGFVAQAAWSPDGRSLAYVYEARDRQELRIYDVATGSTRLLMSHPGPAYVFTLVWSPGANLVGVTMAG